MLNLGLVLVPLALLTACSGGGTATASGGVSKADYLSRAEAICTRANAEQANLTTPTAVSELAPYVRRVVALADQATRQIADLEAPKADRSAIESKVLRPLAGQLVERHAYADKVSAAAKAGDQTALVTLLGSPPTGSRADLAWMKGYGFVACVKAADTSS